ncbi:hypothetical protein MNBD_GAMMA07-1561, partial [hydrothermal vent metagenome]
MNTAYWCVLITILMPYGLGLIARFPGTTLESNLIPRISAESLTGYQLRAYWAHLNGLEAIPSFAAAVIIAQMINVQQDTINTLAMTFVGFRTAHAIAYISNLGLIRTL